MAIEARELRASPRPPSQEDLEGFETELGALVSRRRGIEEDGWLVTSYEANDRLLFVEQDLHPEQGVANRLYVRLYQEHPRAHGGLKVVEQVYGVTTVKPGYERIFEGLELAASDDDEDDDDFQRLSTYEEIVTFYAADGSVRSKNSNFRLIDSAGFKRARKQISSLMQTPATKLSEADLPTPELTQPQLKRLQERFSRLSSPSRGYREGDSWVTYYERRNCFVRIEEELKPDAGLLNSVSATVSTSGMIDADKYWLRVQTYTVSLRDDNDYQGDYSERVDFVDSHDQPLSSDQVDEPIGFGSTQNITVDGLVETYEIPSGKHPAGEMLALFNTIEDLLEELHANRLDMTHQRQILGRLGGLSLRDAEAPNTIKAI